MCWLLQPLALALRSFPFWKLTWICLLRLASLFCTPSSAIGCRQIKCSIWCWVRFWRSSALLLVWYVSYCFIDIAYGSFVNGIATNWIVPTDPNRMVLHPNQAADWLVTRVPSFIKVRAKTMLFLQFYIFSHWSIRWPLLYCPTKQPLVSIFRNWTYALFYMLSNLWGSVMVSLLFWGFANDITTVDEAKK